MSCPRISRTEQSCLDPSFWSSPSTSMTRSDLENLSRWYAISRVVYSVVPSDLVKVNLVFFPWMPKSFRSTYQAPSSVCPA